MRRRVRLNTSAAPVIRSSVTLPYNGLGHALGVAVPGCQQVGCPRRDIPRRSGGRRASRPAGRRGPTRPASTPSFDGTLDPAEDVAVGSGHRVGLPLAAVGAWRSLLRRSAVNVNAVRSETPAKSSSGHEATCNNPHGMGSRRWGHSQTKRRIAIRTSPLRSLPTWSLGEEGFCAVLKLFRASRWFICCFE